MQIGIDSFAAAYDESSRAVSPSERLRNLVEQIEQADQVGPGVRILIVRGGDAAGQATGRDWLAREIGARGGACDAVAAYRRLPPPFGAAERRLAAEGASGAAAWLFSSSAAIANLCRLMPAAGWHQARALVTHERIAEAARAAGFGRVQVSRPSLPALVASIESLA